MEAPEKAAPPPRAEVDGSRRDGALRQELIEEYKLLQNRWDDFDRRSISIRGWFAAGATAAIVLAYNNWSAFAFFALMAASVNVWIMEAIWKSWQHGFGARLAEIEDCLSGRACAIQSMQINIAWHRTYRPLEDEGINPRKVAREMIRFTLLVVYAPFGTVCYVMGMIAAIAG